MNEPNIETSARRAVGIEVLRRLKKLADEELEKDRQNGLWVRRVFVAFAVLGLFAAWLIASLVM